MYLPPSTGGRTASVLGYQETRIAELGTQPRAVRVTELLLALDPPLAEPLLNEPRVLRVHQWITTDDGERHDPMSVAAAASAPVGVA